MPGKRAARVSPSTATAPRTRNRSNTSLSDDGGEKDLADLSYAALLEYAQVAKVQLASAQQPARRKRIMGIRNGRTHLAQIDGVKIYTTVNRNEEDKISELFVTTDREGTTIMGLLNSLSKTISVMLQYGIRPKASPRCCAGRCMSPTASCRATRTSNT